MSADKLVISVELLQALCVRAGVMWTRGKEDEALLWEQSGQRVGAPDE